MKKLFYIVFGLFAAISSCNVVDNPYGDNVVIDPGDDQFNDTVYNDSTVLKRRILLEDFTGHKCPNCPEGQEYAAQLKDMYPDDFISVAIHNSGPFSKPDTSDPNKPYPSDFNTETGQNLLIKYQVQSFPSGLINRSMHGSNQIVDYSQWIPTVGMLMNDANYTAPRFKVALMNIYNSKAGERSIRINFKVQALQDLAGDYAIAAYLLESHIIAPQKDVRQPDPYVADYEHNHVLRKGFPNTGQGRTIFMDPLMNDIAESVTLAEELSTTIPDEWVPENMEVVVFIYNPATDEIFYAEQLPLSSM